MTGRRKVAAVQMTSRADVEENLDAAERLVTQAAAEGAELIVLPECFAYLGPEAGKLDIAEDLPDGGPILDRCRAIARATRAELILGGFWERATGGDRVRNACVHLDRDGEVVEVYRKIHLFDVDLADGTRLVESETVESGREPKVTVTALGTLGLSVCYDLRFPELYRELVDRGATMLAVPAAFTMTTGKDHWHVLLRARAIESQCYVIAAAQAGHHYGRRVSYGHAMVVDPWGVVRSECGDREDVAVAWMDPDVVSEIRTSLPSLAHRRIGTKPSG